MAHAHGTFDVQITAEPLGDDGLGRLNIAKTWHGDLEGTGHGLMLSAGNPEKGEAAYVALEIVQGTLDGRRGSLAFTQRGILTGGSSLLEYDVAPGSGTEQLTGITGTLELQVDDDGVHTYDLTYELREH